MDHFCTYFDHRYLPRGLALYQSLAAHCRSFRLWVLCLDDVCYQALTQMAYPSLLPIRLEEFESGDQDLQKAKQNRTLLEYYFTCTPCLPLYLLQKHADIGMITYLDSDLFLFADPTPVFQEMGDRSIAITEHRYSQYVQLLPAEHFPPTMHGLYNVGWLTFRNDANGLACLKWWRERCLEWCQLRAENGRYADQKYLDEWPTRVPGVAVLRHKGVNVGPWTLGDSQVGTRGNKVTIDGDRLIAFHFHGLRTIRPFVYDVSWSLYRMELSTTVRQKIYAPYIKALNAMYRVSSRFVETAPLLEGLKGNRKPKTQVRHRSPLRWASWMVDDLSDLIFYIVYERTLLLVINGHAL
jgi:hypothetical protein